MHVLLTAPQLNLTVNRLAQQLTERDEDISSLIFIGIQPRGVYVSERIVQEIRRLYPSQQIQYGVLDITFYRDDVRSEIHVANKTDIPFSVQDKKVILIDDVLYTGRTVRAALDALQDFGRPKKVELCVLVNRRFERELPIQPEYYGIAIDTHQGQKVNIKKESGEVIISESEKAP